MKTKILMLLCVVFAAFSTAKADDGKQINFNALPVKAQQMIKAHFPNQNISYALQDEEDLFSKEYDVVFTDGSKIDFDAKGNWTSISMKNASVPSSLILPGIKAYVGQTYPNQQIVKIENDRRDYEVKLDNNLELKFDKKGKFMRIDR